GGDIPDEGGLPQTGQDGRGLRKHGCQVRLVSGQLVVRFQHSHPILAGTFANVGIKGPLENIDSSGALDLTFAYECSAGGSERQIRSTDDRINRRLVVLFQHSYAIAARSFANVGIKGPREDLDSSGALDLAFSWRDRGHHLANAKSAPMAGCIPAPGTRHEWAGINQY